MPNSKIDRQRKGQDLILDVKAASLNSRRTMSDTVVVNVADNGCVMTAGTFQSLSAVGVISDALVI